MTDLTGWMPAPNLKPQYPEMTKDMKIPSHCPKCGKLLRHVNALDTSCRLYMVYCTGWGCMWGEIWHKEKT